MDSLRIATRKSPLALWQAHYVAKKIKTLSPHLNIELVPIVTSGDRFQSSKGSVNGKNLFVKELEEALFNKCADIAVHSIKDMPNKLPQGLLLSAILPREQPWDVLITKNGKTLQELPQGALIGTSSLRRQSQLLAYRSDLIVRPLRGNINTRLEKLDSNLYDGVILAIAGLERLNLATYPRQVLDADIMLPACGQGALGIECREEDILLQQFLSPLQDRLSTLCVNAERQVNHILGGNCKLPFAVYCQAQPDNKALLRAKVLSIDGRTVIQSTQQGALHEFMILAEQCAKSLLTQGAAKLLEEIDE